MRIGSDLMRKVMTCFRNWCAHGSLWARIAFVLFFCLAGGELFCFTGQLCAAGVEIMTPRPGGTVIARNPETNLVIRLTG
jgi:hypothetical protein